MALFQMSDSFHNIYTVKCMLHPHEILAQDIYIYGIYVYIIQVYMKYEIG